MPWPRKFRARYSQDARADPRLIIPQAGSKDAPYELSESDDQGIATVDKKSEITAKISRARMAIALQSGSKDAPYQLFDNEPETAVRNDTPGLDMPDVPDALDIPDLIPSLCAIVLEEDVLANRARRHRDESDLTNAEIRRWELFQQDAMRLPPQRPGGLHNVNATTCYLNSALQLISVVQPFRNIILQHDCNRGDDCMACALRTVLSRMTLDKTASAYPVILAFHLHRHLWVFGQQLDASEFFDKLIEALAISLVSGSIYETIHMFASWKLMCKECHDSRTEAPEPLKFWNLGITGDSIQRCIDADLNVELLQGEYAVSCDRCVKKTPTAKSVYMVEVGEVLIILLNPLHRDRARVDIDVKIENVVHVPTTRGIVSFPTFPLVTSFHLVTI